jgi:hypothetical protein
LEAEMEISYIDSGKMVISGEMKSIENYTEIKNAIAEMNEQGASQITIEIEDSMTITSSIIGLFTKSVHGDKIKINLIVHNSRLYNLLEDLNLIAVFNVRKP